MFSLCLQVMQKVGGVFTSGVRWGYICWRYLVERLSAVVELNRGSADEYRISGLSGGGSD